MPATQLKDIFVGDYYTALDPVNSPEKRQFISLVLSQKMML
ncbi:hypothetical protein [Acinetobacter seifertii]